MEILIIILTILFALISIPLIWINMPGTFLFWLFMTGYAWFTHFSLISGYEVLLVFFILLVLEILEFSLGGLVAKYTGAENRSIFLAILGGVFGTILLGSLFLVVGALLGLCFGSYLGVYFGEKQAGKSAREARKSALAVLLGNLAAKVLKTAMTLSNAIWMMMEIM